MEKQELTVMELSVLRYIISSSLTIMPRLKKHEKAALLSAHNKLTNNEVVLQRETGVAYDLTAGELKSY